MREPTEEQFLKDVSDHKMEVALNQGTYRHVRFRSTKHGYNQWFDLVTWPGVLTISGDMGTWTFSRLPDMFEFFRGQKINPHYWAEKLQHGNYSGRQGGKVWDEDYFKERLLAKLKEVYEFKGKKLKEITEAIEDEVFRHNEGNKYAMLTAAYEFTYVFEADQPKKPTSMREQIAQIGKPSPKQFQFDGMDLPDGMVYSFHFIWCIYAIVWGIQQYDASTAAPSEIPVAF